MCLFLDLARHNYAYLCFTYKYKYILYTFYIISYYLCNAYTNVVHTNHIIYVY